MMKKRNLWIATGSLGVVALGASAASAGTYQNETDPGQSVVIGTHDTQRLASEQQTLPAEESNTRALQTASANTANTAPTANTANNPASAPTANTAPTPMTPQTPASAPSPVSAQSAQSAQTAQSAPSAD
ncbi:MAG TPA: hypothetical protein VFI97_05065 [Arthrobacter sp.]|nr:hypothetical protein [Arthrobacter sp.]